MIPLHIKDANIILKSDQPGVMRLCAKAVDGCLVMRFEPTPQDLDVLNAGGAVEVWVMGGTMPPIALGVSPLGGE